MYRDNLALLAALLVAVLVHHAHAVKCKEITSSNWTNLGADDQCPGGTLYAGENDADSAEGQSTAQYQSNCCRVSPSAPPPPLQKLL